MRRQARVSISLICTLFLLFSMFGAGMPSTVFAAAEVIDYSHESPASWGFTLGTNDEVERWQTITMTKDGKLDKIGVYVLKKGTSASISNLVVNLYETANDLPFGPPLKSVEAPLAGINFAGETLIPIDYDGMKAGQKYAVALTQTVLAENGLDNCYQWPTRDIGVDEQFGKAVKNSDGTLRYVDESFLGTGWIKAYLTTADVKTPAAIEVTAGSAELEVGQTTMAAAVVKDENGEIIPDAQITWSSSNESVAAVDEDGNVTALSAGNVSINASCANIIGSVSITVKALQIQLPETVEVTAPDIRLKTKETIQLTATVRDGNGEVLPNAEVKWSSSKDTLAVVDSNGMVTALKPGKVVITASAGTVADSIALLISSIGGAVEPYPGMVITSDVKFVPGTYDFNGQEGIIIAADNITVDGNGAVLKGGTDRINTPTSGQYEFYMGSEAGMPDEGDAVMKTLIDLTGSTTAMLEYDTWFDIEYSWDALMVQISEDGQTWTSLSTDKMKAAKEFEGSYTAIRDNLPGYTGNSEGWLHEQVNLSQYAGKKIYLQFRYMTDWAVQNKGAFIDTIRITADNGTLFQDDAENGMSKWITGTFQNGNNVANVKWMTVTGLLREPGYAGTGIKSIGKSGITLKNITVKGFNLGLYIENGENWTIKDNDFSDNFTDPEFGWGDPYPYGGVLLENVKNSVIKNNKGCNVWTGLYLRHSDNNTITDNDFSHNSNVCLKMWNSSNNLIRDNNFSYGIRIDPGEVHARDSTSLLMESGSNDNKFYRNDFTHGGDGIFIRVLNGFCSTGNYFEENDASYANNNAVESWSPGNTYVRNKANYSSYGFWLGGSDDTVLIGNEAAYNGIEPHNAPEAFGNAGISVVNGSSSHFKLIGNYVHDNYGPGVAIRYDADYPAYHWVIQKNIIKDNKTSAYNANHKGYGIYLKNAKWLDIGGNEITGNEAGEICKDSNVSDVFVREASIKDAEPVALLKTSSSTFHRGEEIVFDASGSTDPNGAELGYRWDLGDGTIENTPAVRHSFDKAGFYRVGLTVNNGKLADLAYIDLFVVDEGEETGTEAPASAWGFAGNGSGAELTEDSRYFVDGMKSIHLFSLNGTSNTLIYPNTKDLGMDLSEKYGVSFNIKYESEADTDWGQNNKKPIVRLYQDDSNYFEYIPGTAYLEQIFAADAARSPRAGEFRTGWRNLSFSFVGSNGWTMSRIGNPSLNNINYLSITEGPASMAISDFWVDGLKFTSRPDYVYNGADMAENKDAFGFPKAIYSSSASGSVFSEWNPLNGLSAFNGDATPRWSSLRLEENSNTDWYGVDFGLERLFNRVDVYFYNNPSGNLTGDIEGKPVDYSIEYWNGEGWTPVTVISKSSPYPVPNLNTVIFEPVKASKVRTVMKNQPGLFTSIYAFKVFNTKNVAALRDETGQPMAVLTSSAGGDSILQKVGLWLNSSVADPYNDPDLSDVIVKIYAVQNNKPAGNPLKVVTVPKSSVKFGQETIIDIDYRGLQMGQQYAVLVTQSVITTNADGNNMTHYRWPTKSNVLNAQGEHFGKYDGSSYADESFLGAGWLKVYTDKYTVDYSFSSPGSGFGVGHEGENARWQTFTTPQDPVMQVIDGSVEDDNGWSAMNAIDNENWLEMDFAAPETISRANIYFDSNDSDTKLPAEYRLQYFDGTGWNDVKTLSSPEAITKGFNEIEFNNLSAYKVRLLVKNQDGARVMVRELELFKD